MFSLQLGAWIVLPLDKQQEINIDENSRKDYRVHGPRRGSGLHARVVQLQLFSSLGLTKPWRALRLAQRYLLSPPGPTKLWQASGRTRGNVIAVEQWLDALIVTAAMSSTMWNLGYSCRIAALWEPRDTTRGGGVRELQTRTSEDAC